MPPPKHAKRVAGRMRIVFNAIILFLSVMYIIIGIAVARWQWNTGNNRLADGFWLSLLMALMWPVVVHFEYTKRAVGARPLTRERRSA